MGHVRPLANSREDFADDVLHSRRSETEVVRRLERACGVFERNVRREHTRSLLGWHRIEIISGAQGPPGRLAQETVVSQVIVQVGSTYERAICIRKNTSRPRRAEVPISGG